MEKNKSTIKEENRVKEIIEYFTRKTQRDGVVFLDYNLLDFSRKYKICSGVLSKIIHIYYTIPRSSHNLIPNVKGFRMTEQLLLKEIRYHNVARGKKYAGLGSKAKFNIAVNNTNNKLEIVKVEDLKVYHNVLATAITQGYAEKRWKELASERLAKIR